jgi:hypothetical protein
MAGRSIGRAWQQEEEESQGQSLVLALMGVPRMTKLEKRHLTKVH